MLSEPMSILTVSGVNIARFVKTAAPVSMAACPSFSFNENRNLPSPDDFSMKHLSVKGAAMAGVALVASKAAIIIFFILTPFEFDASG